MAQFFNGVLSIGATPVVLLGAFLICFLGYALGSIKIKGISLGTAGVFLIALLCGYLFTLEGLQSIPVIGRFYINGANTTAVENYGFLADIGLVLFVTAVGFIAGPNFFRNLKKNAKSYVPMGIVIVLIGAAITVIFALIPGIGSDYSNGILSGALTSTPAFSAAKQVAENEGLVALGHAVAYPFGVIGVVLFVQIMPRILKADMARECELIRGDAPVIDEAEPKKANKSKKQKKCVEFDEFGFAAFGLAIVLGILLGSIKIPLTANGFGGACFSLGNTGGPLIVALLLGHFAHIGPVSMKISDSTLKVFRELGLMLFLIGAGVEGGVELIAQVQASEYGVMLVVYGLLAGVVMTLAPMVVGYFMGRRVFKLSLLNNLGSLTGGMTSTPALGTLIGVSGTDDVAAAYASTYPMALVLIVLASNLIGTFVA